METNNESNANCILETLKTINTPYVLLLLDDFFLCDYVNNDVLNTMLLYIKKYKAGNLRFVKGFSTGKILNEAECLFLLEPESAYRIGLSGSGIWEKSFLEELLEEYDNLWSFEREGSFNIKASKKPVLVCKYKEFPCIDAVHKGKYEQFAAALLSMNHINIDESQRKIMSNKDVVKEYLKGAIIDINPTLVVKIQNILHIGFKSK